jgi:Trk K+ transport system NAD-binding subunit
MGRRAAPAKLSQASIAPSIRNLVGGVLFVLAVGIAAVIGYVSQGWSLGDAVYMTVLTVFTVGYDEVEPISSPALRAITIGLIFFGCTGMIFLTGALVQFITFRGLQEVLGTRRMRGQIEKLQDHTIICGFGRIGRMLARDLEAASTPFVVIEADPARAAEVLAAGYLSVEEDATDETALTNAGIQRARVLATALPNDAANVFITLSARSLNRELTIIARGEAPSTERKLIQAGADHVILPAHIGADRMAELILYPATVAMVRAPGRMREMEQDLRRLGLELALAVVEQGSANDGRTISEVEHETGFLIVAVEAPGSDAAERPGPTRRLSAGDGVTLIGHSGPIPLTSGFSRL